MSIDFSQVKTITIPEGSVTKITDPIGTILWQAGGQSEGWHTIWEGNKTCSLTRSGTAEPVISGTEQNFVQTVAGTGKTPKIRITFSYSNTNTDYNNWKNEFYINGSEQTTISSPATIEAVKDFAWLSTSLCFASCRSSDKKATFGAGLKSKSDKTNNSINISLTTQFTTNTSSYNSNFTITFTVTKIEQYY